MKISYWSDYNCPYCYIGITRLNNAIKKVKLDEVKMDIHAFELNVNAPKIPESTTLERFTEKYNMSREDAEKEIEKISKWGLNEGLTMNYASTRFTNTRDAHRLTKLAIQTNNQEIINKLSTLFFEAYFGDNLELANHDVLLDLSLKAGLDKNKVIDVLNSDMFNKEVILDERVALETGIRGVPYYIFNNKYAVPGVLPTSEFINVLKKIKFEEDIAKEYKAQQCQTDTC